MLGELATEDPPHFVALQLVTALCDSYINEQGRRSAWLHQRFGEGQGGPHQENELLLVDDEEIKNGELKL
jgi:hypothetical protein